MTVVFRTFSVLQKKKLSTVGIELGLCSPKAGMVTTRPQQLHIVRNNLGIRLPLKVHKTTRWRQNTNFEVESNKAHETT